MNLPRRDTFVSVVAPIRDEAQYVGDFVMELHKVLESNYQNYEIIIVDDNSSDGTEAILRGLLSQLRGLRILRLSRSFGRETAVLAGLESAIGDYVVVMIAESDPVELVPMMVERCRVNAPVVIGVEQGSLRRSWVGRLASTAFHWYCRHQLHMDLHPGSGYFRTFSRSALNAILQIQDRVRNLRHLSGAIGFMSDTFTFQPRWRGSRPRPKRFSKDLSEGFRVVLANSKHPLRLVTNLGLLASALNLVFAAYCCFWQGKSTETLPSLVMLSFQQAILFFLIFVILAILAEYIGLVLWEARARPSYFISREEQSNPILRISERRNVVNEA